MADSLLLVGHGSRDPEGVEEFKRVGNMVTERRSTQSTALAYLEFERPTIQEAVTELANAGAGRIIVLPGMLFATGHLKVDLPRELGVATNRWPNIKFVLADALSPHRKLLELSQLRWDEAIRNRPQHPAKDTLLLLVARGSSDPAITSSFEDVANQLVAAYDAARAVTCYSGMATPLIRDALDAAVQGPHRRIVVQPYFLFTGVLVKQLHKITADWARRHPNKEILSTDHLGVHPLLADVFKERARDALAL